MSKQKGSEREGDRERKAPSSPDTGQGSAGDFGSDADLGKDSVSDDDEKSNNDTQDSPVPVKKKDKVDSDS